MIFSPSVISYIISNLRNLVRLMVYGIVWESFLNSICEKCCPGCPKIVWPSALWPRFEGRTDSQPVGPFLLPLSGPRGGGVKPPVKSCGCPFHDLMPKRGQTDLIFMLSDNWNVSCSDNRKSQVAFASWQFYTCVFIHKLMRPSVFYFVGNAVAGSKQDFCQPLCRIIPLAMKVRLIRHNLNYAHIF